jgi:hypothetical protein
MHQWSLPLCDAHTSMTVANAAGGGARTLLLCAATMVDKEILLQNGMPAQRCRLQCSAVQDSAAQQGTTPKPVQKRIAQCRTAHSHSKDTAQGDAAQRNFTLCPGQARAAQRRTAAAHRNISAATAAAHTHEGGAQHKPHMCHAAYCGTAQLRSNALQRHRAVLCGADNSAQLKRAAARCCPAQVVQHESQHSTV